MTSRMDTLKNVVKDAAADGYEKEEIIKIVADELKISVFCPKIIAEGADGECLWELNELGLLRIYPENGTSGTLANQSSFKYMSPWIKYYRDIKRIVVENGVKTNTEANCLFCNLSNCVEMDLSGMSTEGTVNMAAMFSGCTNLVKLNLNTFDTSKVTNMYGMFQGCKELTDLNVDSFRTQNVLLKGEILGGCDKLENGKELESKLFG